MIQSMIAGQIMRDQHQIRTKKGMKGFLEDQLPKISCDTPFTMVMGIAKVLVQWNISTKT